MTSILVFSVSAFARIPKSGWIMDHGYQPSILGRRSNPEGENAPVSKTAFDESVRDQCIRETREALPLFEKPWGIHMYQ